ncbi:MAG: hypothetical protein M3295_04615, partial [Chloroflexota bacterium]|nr:hypothetical protein [Chloroflexota bacterium]
GHAAVTEAGYVGLDVHLAARICSAAHGGQTLLSDAAHAALMAADADGGVPDVSFTELGSFPLHGLPESHRLVQAVARGMRGSFPPPRTSASSYTTDPAAKASTLS